jgi:hypothetical protein
MKGPKRSQVRTVRFNSELLAGSFVLILGMTKLGFLLKGEAGVTCPDRFLEFGVCSPIVYITLVNAIVSLLAMGVDDFDSVGEGAFCQFFGII